MNIQKYFFAILILLSGCTTATTTSVFKRELLPLLYTKDSMVKVWVMNKKYVCYVSELTTDADGSPRAYNPQNKGIDDTTYAFKHGKLSDAIIVYDGKRPYVQNKNDPYPGFYLSQTTLQNIFTPKTDYRRYVNSDEIPYISIPANLEKYVMVGDIAFVYNKHTRKGAYAIIGDSGEDTHIGEGSIKLAKEIGIPLSFKKYFDCSQCHSDIVYIIARHSTHLKPLSEKQMETPGDKLLPPDITNVLLDSLDNLHS
jgi:hypothetical protein